MSFINHFNWGGEKRLSNIDINVQRNTSRSQEYHTKKKTFVKIIKKNNKWNESIDFVTVKGSL